MLSPLGASLSGLQAGLEKLDASANNVANLSTDGFKKERVLLSEGVTGGVVVEIGKSAESGPFYHAPQRGLIEGSNVDLAEEAVEQVLAKYTISMNLAAIKTADEMQKGVIDLLA